MKQMLAMRVFLQIALVAVLMLAYWLLVWEAAAGWIELLKLGIGLVGGSALIFADELWLSNQYTEPGDPVRPLTKSVVFLFALVPVGIFVLTSTASVLAMSLYLGICTALATELVVFFRQPEVIHQRFLWQIQRAINPSEIQWFVSAAVLFVASVILLVLW